MARFIAGLLTGLIIGALSSFYFADTTVNGTAHSLRAGILRYVPGFN